jgi:hypothetical protein
LAFCADFSIPAQSRKEILVANTTPLWLLNNKQHNQPYYLIKPKKRRREREHETHHHLIALSTMLNMALATGLARENHQYDGDFSTALLCWHCFMHSEAKQKPNRPPRRLRFANFAGFLWLFFIHGTRAV